MADLMVMADLMNDSMDDPLLYFRPESNATVPEFADDGDHVSGDTADRKRILVAQAGSEGSTIEPIDLKALGEELKETPVIKDSAAAASALRSEMDSLSALVTQIGAELSEGAGNRARRSRPRRDRGAETWGNRVAAWPTRRPRRCASGDRETV